MVQAGFKLQNGFLSGSRNVIPDDDGFVQRISGNNLPMMEDGHGEGLTLCVRSQVRLETEAIDYRSLELDGNNVLVRFDSEEAQLKAATQVREALYASDRRYSIALNLAPATPEWLTALSALPMYLGLDLRGGVHFLMEVDMESAIEKSL